MIALVYSPRVKHLGDKNAALEINHPKELERAALTLIKEVVLERKAAKKKNPYCVPMISRFEPAEGEAPEVRFFNFMFENIDGVKLADKSYPGALSQAEASFNGKWRLASDDEEKAEYDRQARAKVDAAISVVQLHEALNQSRASGSEAYKKAAIIIDENNKSAALQAENDLLRAQLAAKNSANTTGVTAPATVKKN